MSVHAAVKRARELRQNSAPNLGDILARELKRPWRMTTPAPVNSLLPKQVGASAYEIREFHDDPDKVCGTKLSNGYYGAVYAHENPQLVVKSFEVNDGYPVWAAYAAAAYRSGAGSSILPRVYAMSLPVQYKSDDPDGVRSSRTLGYALIERLECTLSDETALNRGTRYPQHFVRVRESLHDAVRAIRDGGNCANAQIISTGIAATDKLAERAFKHITRFMSEVVAAGVTVCEDMHNANWMLRTNGDVVMIDPVSSGYESDGNKVLALAHNLCKRANTFTPGFYSQYRLERVVDTNL